MCRDYVLCLALGEVTEAKEGVPLSARYKVALWDWVSTCMGSR